jgi:hypothetical protein
MSTPFASLALAVAIVVAFATAFHRFDLHVDRAAELRAAELAAARHDARAWLLAQPIVVMEAHR